jgi:hypothetical protein
LPKRPRPGSRQRRKERKRPAASQPAPSAAVTPREPPEAPRRADAHSGSSSVTTTPTKATARHIAKDYSYVFGELRRIGIIVLVIVAGLIAAAVALR